MRDFLKYTFASLTGTILFFVLFVGLATVGAIGLIGALIAGLERDRPFPVDQDSILVYDLSTPIVDSEQAISPADALLGPPGRAASSQIMLREAVTAIQQAATDDRIVGLYLTGSNSSIGVGSAASRELRGALETFRESGKPIIAYNLSWDERGYYLASVAETIYMNPFGEMEMNGFFAQVMYQAEAFENLGIGVQVTQAGQYKSAAEPLIRNEMSPEEREQLQTILDDLWQNTLEAASEYRTLQPQQLQAIADGPGLLFGEEARAEGLADEIAYADEVFAHLRELTGEEPDAANEESFRQIDLGLYTQAKADPRLERTSNHQQIAVVYAEGAIVTGMGDGRGQIIAGDRLARDLRNLRNDDSVQAIVLRVNSPGGSATASEVILREMQLTAEKKPVVVSMGNVAASGGYWIATHADRIFAEPTTITGSIGVFGAYLNLDELGSNIGINWDVVKTGETADIFTITRPKTEQELDILQRAVDQIYDQFLDRVAEGRDLPMETVAEIAQGRIWSGLAAQELGLIDELGGLEDAIQAAAELAELGETWQLKELPEGDRWQQFLRQFSRPRSVEQITPSDLLTEQFKQFKDELAVLQTLNDPRHIYARMPYLLDIR